MPVLYEKPALNLRSELASLKNQGGYSEQQFWFENLVTNGTFAADTNWTKGTDWTIAAGVASHANGSASDLSQTFSPNMTLGKSYYTGITVSNYSAGTVKIRLTTDVTVNGTQYSANGSFTETLVAASNNHLFNVYAQAVFVGDVDDVIVYEADPSDDAPWYPMQKGWKPKRVYVDGLLVKEGAAEDYTVITDGFNYWVKPTVAPGVSTRTCITGELA
jgi:hypothetical protein